MIGQGGFSKVFLGKIQKSFTTLNFYYLELIILEKLKYKYKI